METWLPITLDNLEDKYHVSNLGRVKSLGRYISRPQDCKPRYKKEKLLSTHNNPEKYVVACLGKKYYYVHILVAKIFIPNPSNLREVNHIDLNKSNNRVENLEWKSSSGNKKHAVNSGILFNPLPKSGEDCALSKLDWEKVREIRRLSSLGITQREIAAKFYITQTNIYYIVNFKTWKNPP